MIILEMNWKCSCNSIETSSHQTDKIDKDEVVHGYCSECGEEKAMPITECKVMETTIKTQKQLLFDLCMKDAQKLRKGNFNPELDNLSSETISAIMFKVLIEHDLMVEGEIGIPQSKRQAKTQKVSEFFVKWVDFIDKEDQKPYLSFVKKTH